MVQRLGLAAFDNRAPPVVVAKCLDGERIAVAPHVKSEITVKILRHRRVGHSQHKLVQRMHPERIDFGGRRNIAPDSGHHSLLTNVGRADWPAYRPGRWHEQLAGSAPVEPKRMRDLLTGRGRIPFVSGNNRFKTGTTLTKTEARRVAGLLKFSL